jgi:hypothetical protein
LRIGRVSSIVLSNSSLIITSSSFGPGTAADGHNPDGTPALSVAAGLPRLSYRLPGAGT